MTADPETMRAFEALPDPLPVGAELLDEVEAFLARFVAYPSEHARVAHRLWIAHAHAMDAWDSTPRIAFLSPEPGSGKTRALEVSELLVPRPVEAVNATPAYLFRKVSDPAGAPTILYDEIDTCSAPKAKDNEEIRGCSTPATAAAPWPAAAWSAARWWRPRSCPPTARSRSPGSATCPTRFVPLRGDSDAAPSSE